MVVWSDELAAYVEKVVQERTARLEAANRKLEAEIAQCKRNEASLIEARTAAEAASRAKSQFLASMSHELRTPMTALLGFTELLQGGDCTDEERREYLEIIAQSGTTLLQLVDDILDLSKIEAGKAVVDRVPCSPRRVVDEVVALMQVLAAKKGLALHACYREPLPAAISTDPTRLRQILVNLVGNAIKFASQGQVQIEVAAGDPQPGPKIIFAVSDNGAGIRADQLAKVFEPFNQGDLSAPARLGGTGLGLTISRRLAHMLGGELVLESEFGKGSRAVLTIEAGCVASDSPAETAQTPVVDPSPVPSKNRRLVGRVLLVEDSHANQRLISTILKRTGLQVDATDSGAEACRMAHDAARSGKAYDLVLMDIELPDMSGLDAVGRLRSAGMDSAIVALTAHAMTGDREKCLEAGCDDYLPKPITANALVNLVDQHVTPA